MVESHRPRVSHDTGFPRIGDHVGDALKPFASYPKPLANGMPQSPHENRPIHSPRLQRTKFQADVARATVVHSAATGPFALSRNPEIAGLLYLCYSARAFGPACGLCYSVRAVGPACGLCDSARAVGPAWVV